MSMLDKLSAGANIAGVAASVYPLVQGHKDAKPPHAPNGDPTIDDMGEYNKYKVLTSVGPPPINW